MAALMRKEIFKKGGYPRQLFTSGEVRLSIGAGEVIRSLDPDLGKVVFYPKGLGVPFNLAKQPEPV